MLFRVVLFHCCLVSVLCGFSCELMVLDTKARKLQQGAVVEGRRGKAGGRDKMDAEVLITGDAWEVREMCKRHQVDIARVRNLERSLRVASQKRSNSH